MPEIRVGEKIPGTYCPLCGEIGLRKMQFDGVTWAVCPMVDGEPVVKKLKDAHTAYIIDTKKTTGESKEPTPVVETEEAPEENNSEEGVSHV